MKLQLNQKFPVKDWFWDRVFSPMDLRYCMVIVGSNSWSVSIIHPILYNEIQMQWRIMTSAARAFVNK